MNSARLRTLGAGSSSLQNDKSRSNMASPNRNEKVSPSSKTNLGNSGVSSELSSSRTFGQKAPSISLKPTNGSQVANDRKASLTTSVKGLTLQQTPQSDAKKRVASSNNNLIGSSGVSQSELIPQSAAAADITTSGAGLPQLDISGITPSDLKNDSNGFNSLGSGQKLSSGGGTAAAAAANNTQPSTSTLNLRRGTSNTMNISSTQMNTSFTQQLQKSPGKRDQSALLATPGGMLQSKKIGGGTDTTAALGQSVNLGVVDAGNTSMVMQQSMSAQTAAQREMETSVNFEVLKQFDQKQKSSNIKTFIRVRPLNKMEIEFNENGCGSEDLRFPDSKTVQVLPEKANYILDKVYPPGTEQDVIFEDVGREMVNDVLQGYNGTIFAYGPTGSGKTFTMFGDVNDAKQKGIIPRVSNQIFTHINSVEQDIEFTITVSMLEIYKEQLFDLLKVDRVGLKIKENPQKGGIYVQGLTAISVDCEEEILDTINLGYSSKQTRETRMNEYSSRSHTIFTINVTQRYPNGQEKIGKLNLVDLAGSEKIGKTQASGETLEEAKKINLSLSCLGNVIHSLTSNQEHIPYRDSKLTRILQESLGGNYKTSLIAAISPHSSQHEEQTSTLKFATRAKTIKNVVKMNVKLSVDQMRKLIEQLKAELEKAKAQNTRFRNVINKLKEEFKANQLAMPLTKDGKVSEQQQVMQNTVRALEDILNASELIADDQPTKQSLDAVGGKLSSNKILYEDSELDESTLNNVNASGHAMLASEQLGGGIDGGKIPLSQFSGKRGSAQFKGYSNQLAAIESHHRGGSASGHHGNQVVHNLDYKHAYMEKVIQCRNYEKELIELKRNQLENERKLADVHEEKHKVEVNHTQQVTKNNYNCFEIEIMQKQIQSLIDSICKSENTIGALMKEKQEIVQKKIEELLKEKLAFSEVHFQEYFKKSINFNYDNLVQKWADVQKNMKTIGIDDQELISAQAASQFTQLDNNMSNQERNTKFGRNANLEVQKQSVDDIIRGSFMGNLDFNSVGNPYDMLEGIVEFPDSLEKFSKKHPISRDLTIILLKKQIFNSHIINQHLARTINALEWKQIIEYGKAKMKSVLNKIQATHISNLEQVINEASQNYRTLRNRIESVELETQFVREKIDSHSDAVPKKSKITKDAESIRHLLMKPSNDGIRQSLRGSYIGFQLDIDKTAESPVLKELKEIDELVQKDLLPLTYDRAIEELKQRNGLLRKAYSEFKGTNALSGVNQEFIEQVLKEKERLEGKITMLSNELKMEAYKAEKSNFQMQKEQTKELEEFLIIKMKEENEAMEKTYKKVSDQHEKEILKYQQSFQRVSEKFSEYIRMSLNRLSELKKTSGAVQVSSIDQMYQEMLFIKEQYNKMFNPDSMNANGGESSPIASPKAAWSMGFNPTSMIFKSFAEGNDGMATNKSTKRADQNFTSLIDEIKEQQSSTNLIDNKQRVSNLSIDAAIIAGSVQPAIVAPALVLPVSPNYNSVPATATTMTGGMAANGGGVKSQSISIPKLNMKDTSRYVSNLSSAASSNHYKQNSTGYQPTSTAGLISSYSSPSSSNLKGIQRYGQHSSRLSSSPLSYANNNNTSSNMSGGSNSQVNSNVSSSSKPKNLSTSAAITTTFNLGTTSNGLQQQITTAPMSATAATSGNRTAQNGLFGQYKRN